MKEFAQVTSAIEFWTKLLFEMKEGKVSDVETCFLYIPFKEVKTEPAEESYRPGFGLMEAIWGRERNVSEKQLSIQHTFSKEMTERIIQVIINELKEKQLKLYKEIKL